MKQFTEDQRQKQIEAKEKKLRFREGLDDQLKTESPKPAIGKGTHFGPEARYPEHLADYKRIKNRSYGENLRQQIAERQAARELEEREQKEANFAYRHTID